MCALLDYFAVSALARSSTLTPPATAEGKEGEGEREEIGEAQGKEEERDEGKDAGTNLVSLWKRVKQVLCDVFLEFQCNWLGRVVSILRGVVGRAGVLKQGVWHGEEEGGVEFGMVLDKVCAVLGQVLKAASVEDVKTMANELDKEVKVQFQHF